MATAGKASTPGRVVIYPNREKPTSRMTKVIVVGLLIASAVIMFLITLTGWSRLQGMKPIDILWALIYLVLAFYVGARWSRGGLTLGAGLGIMLLIVVIIAGLGLTGTSWFARDSSGFASPHSIFGGEIFGSAILGAFTIILIPLQLALIAIAMLAFAQAWNIESETSIDEAKKRGYQIPDSVQPAGA